MYVITIINPKGGCGKTTVATHIAGYYALSGEKTGLLDLDFMQRSSEDWLAARPDHRAPIRLAKWSGGRVSAPSGTRVLVLDTPAGMHGKKTREIAGKSDALIVPVLPSPLDIRAADRFIGTLFDLPQVRRGRTRVGTVAVRVREDTLAAIKLEHYLSSQLQSMQLGADIPFLTMLRASQNYIYAAERGLTIFELPTSKTYYDREQWTPLIRWLG